MSSPQLPAFLGAPEHKAVPCKAQPQGYLELCSLAEQPVVLGGWVAPSECLRYKIKLGKDAFPKMLCNTDRAKLFMIALYALKFSAVTRKAL